MGLNSEIIGALSPLGDPVAFGAYQGEAVQYYTFQYTSAGDGFGDDAPEYERYQIQVNFSCPLDFDSEARLRQTKQALYDAGFTWPAMECAADSGGQHIVFKCECTCGGVLGS